MDHKRSGARASIKSFNCAPQGGLLVRRDPVSGTISLGVNSLHFTDGRHEFADPLPAATVRKLVKFLLGKGRGSKIELVDSDKSFLYCQHLPESGGYMFGVGFLRPSGSGSKSAGFSPADCAGLASHLCTLLAAAATPRSTSGAPVFGL